MIRHIHVADLKPGMHVVDLGFDRSKRPQLYAADHHIESESAVQKILGNGYSETFVDLARSDLTGIIQDFSEEESQPGKSRVLLEEELPVAKKLHGASVSYARQFMTDMRSGKVNVSSAGSMVEDIMASLERNADAMLTLCRLHRVDTYTHMHCVNVSVLTTAFSRFLGEKPSAVYAAGFAGLFHDLGKALIPLTILNAPRKLNPVEFASMKRHPNLGFEQLCDLPDIPPEVLQGTLEHHEKHDGSGYPRALAGDAISPIGRKVGVCDVYDALSSERPYKKAMTAHKALGIMYQISDKEFHAEYIARFIRMMGVYPVGSVVELEDGWRGVVAASNAEVPMKPVVRLVMNPRGLYVDLEDRDLAVEESAPIATCLSAESSGINPAEVLGILG